MKIARSACFFLSLIALSHQLCNTASPVSLKSVELLPVPCEADLFDFCRRRGYECVGATTHNLPQLVAILRSARVPSAYVCAWNGQHQHLVVGAAASTVTPYDPRNNPTKYAFCVKCPCPPKKPCPEPCAPAYCPPAPCPPAPVYCPEPCPAPCPPPCPEPLPDPCCRDGPYSDSDPCPLPCPPCPPKPRKCRPRRRECPDFVSCCVRENDCPRFLGDCDRLCKEIEKMKVLRHYVLDAHAPRDRRRDVRLEVDEKRECHDTRYVLLSRRPEEGSAYPNLLRFPEELLRIHRCICKKFCERPCLYIGGRCCDQLFAFVDGCLFHIPVSHRELARGCFDCRDLCFEKVGRRGVERLVKNGLAKVVLHGADGAGRCD